MAPMSVDTDPFGYKSALAWPEPIHETRTRHGKAWSREGPLDGLGGLRCFPFEGLGLRPLSEGRAA
jgi:hypothetical protein